MLGFWSEEENPLGPVQAYVAPATLLAVRLTVLPLQTGVLFPASGATGVGLTVTLVVVGKLGQPNTDVITVYVPDAATVELVMVGF